MWENQAGGSLLQRHLEKEDMWENQIGGSLLQRHLEKEDMWENQIGGSGQLAADFSIPRNHKE